MDLTSAVAVYAALVATAGLGWQIYLWNDRRSHKVEVTARIAIMGMADGSTIDVVSVTATNRSEYDVRISGAGLELQDGSRRELHSISPVPGSDLPGTVASRDSGSAFILRAEVEQAGIDIFEPVTGWIRLSTGETIRSQGSPLMSKE